MGQYFDAMKPEVLGAVPSLKSDLMRRDSRQVRLIDFMGSTTNIRKIKWARATSVQDTSEFITHPSLYEQLPGHGTNQAANDKKSIERNPWLSWMMQVPVVFVFLLVVVRSII